MKVRELFISETNQVSGGIALWGIKELNDALTIISELAQQKDSVNSWQYAAVNDPTLKAGLIGCMDLAGIDGKATVAIWATTYAPE